jgi:hypothetical protein
LGTIVTGLVRNCYANRVLLDVGLGVMASLTKGECLDHAPGERVKWLGLPTLGSRVDVVVRGFQHGPHRVMVSLHSCRQDDRYCSFAAGYRSSFNAQGSTFEKLPWSK